MNFNKTAEIRWFWKGSLPHKIAEASKDFQEPTLKENRTDRYLIFPNNVHIGVKVREGNFEVKSLLQTGNNIKVGRSSLVATCEIWQKISLSNFDWDQSQGEFTDVVKSRISYLFKREDEEWKLSDSLTPSAESCQIELTEINILDQVYWSWGFEASGTNSNLCDLLTSMWCKLSEESSLIQLLEVQPDLVGALSYPSLFRVLELGD